MMRRCDDRGVSKVVGVVLMTAIVIALAGTLAGMLTGFGGILSDPAPQVAFEAEYHDDIDDPTAVHPDLPAGTSEVIEITHTAGDRFDPSDVEVVVRDSNGEVLHRAGWDESITGQEEFVGGVDGIYPYSTGGATFADKRLQLIWSPDENENGEILFEWEE